MVGGKEGEWGGRTLLCFHKGEEEGTCGTRRLRGRLGLWKRDIIIILLSRQPEYLNKEKKNEKLVLLLLNVTGVEKEVVVAHLYSCI